MCLFGQAMTPVFMFVYFTYFTESGNVYVWGGKDSGVYVCVLTCCILCIFIESGDVYVWGGSDSSIYVCVLTCILCIFIESGDVYVWGGNDFSVYVCVLTCCILCIFIESGDVYVWGGNDSGQCGMGDRDEISTPVKLPLDEPVTCISCGYYHTAFVTGNVVYLDMEFIRGLSSLLSS